jgi:hypothetical protein
MEQKKFINSSNVRNPTTPPILIQYKQYKSEVEYQEPDQEENESKDKNELDFIKKIIVTVPKLVSKETVEKTVKQLLDNQINEKNIKAYVFEDEDYMIWCNSDNISNVVEIITALRKPSDKFKEELKKTCDNLWNISRLNIGKLKVLCARDEGLIYHDDYAFYFKTRIVNASTECGFALKYVEWRWSFASKIGIVVLVVGTTISVIYCVPESVSIIVDLAKIISNELNTK